MIPTFEERKKAVDKIAKRLAKIRIGLPNKVEFEYSNGVVICYPKEKRWVIKIKGKSPITHIRKVGRNDVTKHKAKLILKLAIVGLIRD